MQNRERVMQVASEPGTRANSRFFHINDGWHYHMNREDHGTYYFKCVLYEQGCQGRALFDPEDGFQHTKEHSHAADELYPEEMALRNSILQRCRRLDYASYRTILDEEYLRFPPEVVARVTYARMRTPMRNARLSMFPQAPPNLRALSQMLMDPHYAVMTITDDSQDNYFAGAVDDANGDHHVVFASRRQIELMRTFRVLHSDGTFKSVPVSREFAAQVFCIVGVWDDKVILLCVALMSRMTEVAYTAVLRLLQNLCGPDIQLVRAITDFEAAQQNSWEAVFGIHVQGCLWHLCRAFLDIAGILNLIIEMRRIAEVRVIVRMTMALALLPDQRNDSYIVRGFYIIMRHAQDEGNYVLGIVQPYLTFVWRSWVRRPWRRRRMSVFQSNQRTNNVCECNNKSMNDVMVVAHPNVFASLRGMGTLEQRAHWATEQLDAGRRPNRARKRTSILNDENIINLTRQLMNPHGAVNAAIYRFLRTAGHALDNLIDEAMDAEEYRRRRNA